LQRAAQAYIRELEASARARYFEEKFRPAQNKRFAPNSEKLPYCVFDEAE
jgi:hypothetical protein